MRYWRILNIEDNQYSLKKDVYHKLYSDIKKILESNWNLSFYIPGNSEWDIEPESCFPIVLGSVTEAWDIIKKLRLENLTPDICFVDIKLTDQKDAIEGLEDIKKEIIFYFNDLEAEGIIENLFRPDNAIENGKCLIQINGGLYVMALIKKLFPEIPIFVYTESKDIFQKTIPFQFAGAFRVLTSGKFLMPESSTNKAIYWTSLLVNQMKHKIQSGAVSLEEIYKALTDFKKSVKKYKPEDLYNRKTPYKEHLKTLLEHYIGLIERDWSFASFFAIQLPDLLSKDLEYVNKGLEEIENIISSINLPKSLKRFITQTDFSSFSHPHSERILNPLARNQKADELIKALRFDILREISKQLLREWKNSNCSSSNETEVISQILIEATESKNEIDFRRIFNKTETAKKSIRINLLSTFSYLIEIQKQYTNFNIGLFLNKSFCHNNISEYSAILLKESNSVNHEIYLPIYQKENEYKNMFFDLIDNTFSSIYKHGFQESPRCDNVVNVHILNNSESFTWTIIISQIGGNRFDINELNDPYFFNNSNGDFRRSLNRVKNWIDVKIISDGWERNPHLIMSAKKVNDDVMIDNNSIIEFIYKINYL